MMGLSNYRTSISVCLVLALSLLGAGSSQVVTAQPVKVFLIATLDGGPAMREVEWKVYRQGDTQLAGGGRTHTLILPLPPGDYQLTAQLQTVRRVRDFSVAGESGPLEVVVAMDEAE